MSRKMKVLLAVLACLTLFGAGYARAARTSCGSDSDFKGGRCSTGKCSNGQEYYK